MVFVIFFLLVLINFSTKQKLKSYYLFFAILVLSYDLISFGFIYNTASPKRMAFPETDAIRFLKKDSSLYRTISYGSFMHNFLSPFGIEDIGGYSAFYPRRYGEYLHVSQYGNKAPMPENFSRWMFFRSFGSPLLNLINTKYLLLPPTWTPKSPSLRLVYNKEIKIYKNHDAFPRIFFVPRYQFCKNSGETLEKLSSFKNAHFKEHVLLEAHPPKDFLRKFGDIPTDKLESTINIISYKPDGIEMAVSSNQNGFLVISNNFNAGWKARIDGNETQVLRANYIMQALPIEKGNHSVKVVFRPTLSIASIIISSIGWVVLILLIGTYGIKEFMQMRKVVNGSAR